MRAGPPENPRHPRPTPFGPPPSKTHSCSLKRNGWYLGQMRCRRTDHLRGDPMGFVEPGFPSGPVGHDVSMTPPVPVEFARGLYRARMRLAQARIGPMAAILICLVACLLPGAAVASASPFRSAQIDFGGLVRTFELHVPAGVDHPLGLVVNLHAAGATGRDQAALTHYDSVADAHGFVTVHPDGIDFSWADGRGASLPDRQGVDDVGFIAALVGTLVAVYGIDPGRVFAT